MRLTYLLLLTLLAVPHAGLAAESDPLHLAGSRVRLSAPELGARKQAGIVTEVRGDTLLFTADNRSTRTPVPTGSLTGLEISRGMHSHVASGAALGFLGGAVVGGVIGKVAGGSTKSTLIGAVAGAAAGTGAVLMAKGHEISIPEGGKVSLHVDRPIMIVER